GAGGSVDLSLSTETMGDRTIVRVGGEIDVYTAPKLREQLVELVNDGSFHLVVDMEGVDFLDSTGLGVLVGGLKRVRAHEGSLRLVCNQEINHKIIRITGLSKVIPTHSSVEEAVAAIDCPSSRAPCHVGRSEVREGPGSSAARPLHRKPEVARGMH